MRHRDKMDTFLFSVLLVSVCLPLASGKTIEDPKRLVKELLEQWKDKDEIKIPVIGISDPYPMQDFQAGGADFSNNEISGLTNIILVSVTVEQTPDNTFEAKAEVLIPELVVNGDIMYENWWSSVNGQYTATLSGIVAIGGAVPVIDEAGMVQLAKIEPDVTYDNLHIELDTGGGIFGSVLTTLVNSLNSIIFSFIKPTLVEIINEKGIPVVNEQLAEKLEIRFPNSINMIDSLIANERTDKLPSSIQLEDIQLGGSVSMHLHHGYVEGLRTIHRAGPVRFVLSNHTFHVLVELGVGSLKGGYDWKVPLWIMDYRGKLNFELEGFTVLLNISQSANIEMQPVVNELSFNIESVAVIVDGVGYGDYIMEFFMNVIPNLLKNAFYRAARLPLTAIANHIAQSITPQDIVDQHL